MKGFAKKRDNEEKNTVIIFLKALAASYALTAVIFLVLALCLTYTDMNEGLIPVISALTTALAAFFGGFVSGRGIGSRGLICGALAALFYILVMLVIGIFTRSGTSLGLGSVPVAVMAFGAGALGGVLGVNSRA